jgi:hypothetical protein
MATRRASSHTAAITAAAMVKTFHDKPAALPPSTATSPNPPTGISTSNRTTNVMMPKMMEAAMARTSFIPMYPA